MSRAARAAQRIRAEVPLLGVLADYGYDVDTRGEGREQQFSCDLHGDGQDTKPSARVYPDGGQFFCFACNRSRDAVALAQEKEGLTFWQAVRKIEQRYGLSPLPWEPGDEDREPTAKEVVEEALDTSETPEQALARVSRFVDNLTRERELEVAQCAGLWEAYDRVVFFEKNGGGDGDVVRLAHKILAKAKLHLKERAEQAQR